IALSAIPISDPEFWKTTSSITAPGVTGNAMECKFRFVHVAGIAFRLSARTSLPFNLTAAHLYPLGFGPIVIFSVALARTAQLGTTKPVLPLCIEKGSIEGVAHVIAFVTLCGISTAPDNPADTASTGALNCPLGLVAYNASKSGLPDTSTQDGE